MHWKCELLLTCFCTCMNLTEKIIGLLHQPLLVSPASPSSNNMGKLQGIWNLWFSLLFSSLAFQIGYRGGCFLLTIRCGAMVGRKRLISREAAFRWFLQGCPLLVEGKCCVAAKLQTKTNSAAIITLTMCSPKCAAESVSYMTWAAFVISLEMLPRNARSIFSANHWCFLVNREVPSLCCLINLRMYPGFLTSLWPGDQIHTQRGVEGRVN